MALLADMLGWSGALVALVAYISLSLGKLTNGWLFQVAQLFASVSIMTSSYYYGAWPSVALNAVWALIAVVALGRIGATSSALLGRSAASQANGQVDGPADEAQAFCGLMPLPASGKSEHDLEK